jgi:hypothetical protein
MDYAIASQVVSIADVIVWVVLLVIVLRRARNNAQVTVSRHALVLEGPLVTFGLLVGVVLLISAAQLSPPNFQEIAHFVAPIVRGALLVFGLYIFGFYWLVRETWW